MKTLLATSLIVGLTAWSLAVHAQPSPASNGDVVPATGLEGAEPEEILPLVQFEDAPLVDVIKTLARQASLNIVFDPQVVAVGPDGRSPYAPVSIRLENVTAQNVLEAVLNNNNLRLERDPRTRISRVTIRDPQAAEPLELKIYQLKYSNPTNMMAIIRPTVSPRSQVIPDARTSRLIVLATERELVEVENLIERLDTITRQVLIEARILQTMRNPETIKGINWAGTFQAQNVVAGNNAFPSSGGETGGSGSSGGGSLNDPLTQGGTPSLMAFLRSGYAHPVAHLNADGARAVFSFFNQDNETEIISTPRAVTADNSTATLEVTTAVPIYRVTQGTQFSGPTVDITYTNVGTILEVTPRVSADENIFLTVVPEVSSLLTPDRQVIAGQETTANRFAVRRVQTQVLIPSGNTLVLGGLMGDMTSEERTKVPLLGDLPGMKYIFGHRSKKREKSNLLVFVTPTIVEEGDYQPTRTDFLRQPVPTDVPYTDFGSFDRPWDGTEPYDWGAPVY